MPKKTTKQTAAVALMLSVSLTIGGCGYTASKQTPKVSTVTPAGSASASYYEKEYFTDRQGIFWIPLKPAVAALGYRMKDESTSGGYAKIGYSDVMFMLRPDTKQALSLGHKLELPDTPQRRKGQIYITPRALSKLLQTEVGWNPYTYEINIAPPSESKIIGESDRQDEPKPIRAQSLSGADSRELVAYAKKFLGVPYEFGAAPYEDSHKFDCSSFTQHVFRKFGVDLPRLAKDQDNLGSRVTRNELVIGDLIFFTVPGRFETDAIPGHVGIYIGNGEFIHTWGDPGVQISDLDNGYWSNVILHMQRVL
ncbi:C40 family peptidase [Paenibacillus albidus]|uniref:C40 family peptidase n=1 Tax=Paenibacillus albidus TaxID=2041023 RepID=UPI001BEBCB54|nr:C40 family peptidase [Paenibacillus albidus]MBT2293099.1 C40 family peptidase [Paenibacillus albidus]